MQIIIPFGCNDKYEKNIKIAKEILLIIKNKTNYCGWIEDNDGNIIYGII